MRKYLLSPISHLLSPICGDSRHLPICRAPRGHRAFTLVEVLIVIVIIGILATLVTGAAQYAMRTARAKRLEVSRHVLETAILRYRTEYNEWPGNGATSYTGADNAKVFGPLRVSSTEDNVDRIPFLDETTFYTKDASGKGIKRLSEAGSGAKPLIFQGRSGKWKNDDGYLYYKVVINYADETVEVSAPGFDDEGK